MRLSANTATAAGAAAARQQRKVLVIDDEPLVRRVIARLLEVSGHEVVSVSSLAEGKVELAAARGSGTPPRPFEVVISDVYMDGGDGLEVLAFLRREYRTTKIIVISGRFGVDTFGAGLMKMARHLGADEVLVKPIAGATMLEAIERVCLGDTSSSSSSNHQDEETRFSNKEPDDDKRKLGEP